MKKKTNKKSTFELYTGWQLLLEFLAISSVSLFVMSIESQWTKEYFIFVGVLAIVFIVSASLLHKFGK